MDEINKSITKSLQTGQYYIDARRWYLQKYLFPVVERNILIIITSIFIAIILFMQSYNIIFGTKDVDDYNYLVNINNITNNYALIKELDNKISPQEAIAKYMCEAYVEKYESYDYNNLQESINFIYHTSSANIKQSYEYLMSLNNPNSPLVLYQNNGTKKVNIISSDIKENKCEVIYDLSIIPDKNSNSQNSKWKANISFKIEKMYRLIAQKNNKLGFTVLNYTTQKVE